MPKTARFDTLKLELKNTMITTIGFDADDTLWDYEYIYNQVNPKIANILGDGYNSEKLFRRLGEVEVHNIPLYGYGIKSYALSLIETVARSSGQPIDNKKLIKLIELIREMLDTHFNVMPLAEETLSELSSAYDLILITKGEAYEQERKIERSGLAGYFKAIEIVSFKTEDTYRKVLKKKCISPENFVMVGNSLKSDILPTIGIGAKAIYIPHEQVWFHEQVSDVEALKARYKQVKHLGQLPEFIKTNYLTKSRQ